MCVCAYSWKEEGGTGGVVEPATSSWCINYPLSVFVTYTYTHIYMYTNSHGCLQTLRQRYTHTVTINNIVSHAIMCFMHTMIWNYHTWDADIVIFHLYGCARSLAPSVTCRVYIQLWVWCVCEFSRVSVTQSSTDQMYTTPVIWSFSVRITHAPILEAIVMTFSLWKWNDASVTLMFFSDLTRCFHVTGWKVQTRISVYKLFCI